MGEPLVGLLGEAGNEVHVTTRQERKPGEGIPINRWKESAILPAMPMRRVF